MEETIRQTVEWLGTDRNYLALGSLATVAVGFVFVGVMGYQLYKHRNDDLERELYEDGRNNGSGI